MVDRIAPATARADVEAASACARRARRGRGRRRAVSPMGHRRPNSRANGRRGTLPGRNSQPNAKPYEQIKMRVLNAAQSTLAHQGALVWTRVQLRGGQGSNSFRVDTKNARAGDRIDFAKSRRHGGWSGTSKPRWRASAIAPSGIAATRSARTDRRRSFSGWWTLCESVLQQVRAQTC